MKFVEKIADQGYTVSNPEPEANELWSWIQSYTQKKVEEALEKVDFKQGSNPLDPDYK